jgi:glycosyltransferase involved in cell wall biosynthesis
MPVLSICIPTHNRSHLLRESLASILASADRYKDQVEIVISDNASTDSTAEVVEVFRGKGHTINFVRQKENIGPHRNFRAVAEKSHGRYVWLFGDDDKMAIEAVGEVLERIQDGADMVVCNISVWSHDFTSLVRPNFVSCRNDLLFSDHNEVMRTIGLHVGYISAVILDKKKFLEVPISEYMLFDKDDSAFMFSFYYVIRSCSHIVFIAAPLVLNRGAELKFDLALNKCKSAETFHTVQQRNAQWNRCFAEGFPRTLDAFADKGYHRSDVRSAKNRAIIDYLIPRMFLLKRQGHGSWILVKSAYKYLHDSWAFWLLLIPLSIQPKFIVLGLVHLKWLIKKKNEVL